MQDGAYRLGYIDKQGKFKVATIQAKTYHQARRKLGESGEVDMLKTLSVDFQKLKDQGVDLDNPTREFYTMPRPIIDVSEEVEVND